MSVSASSCMVRSTLVLICRPHVEMSAFSEKSVMQFKKLPLFPTEALPRAKGSNSIGVNALLVIFTKSISPSNANDVESNSGR